MKLSFHNHISKICSTSFYHIRHLRQVRSSLDKNSAIILANALVSSKLDFCNSLFYGLPATSVNRLQKVQNALARVVVPSVKRSHHITPTLRDLHWLPINNRITFKVASITFKTLQSQQPSYLFDLLSPHKPSRNLRSADLHLLTVPFVKTAFGRRSFFLCCSYRLELLASTPSNVYFYLVFLLWTQDFLVSSIDFLSTGVSLDKWTGTVLTSLGFGLHLFGWNM